MLGAPIPAKPGGGNGETAMVGNQAGSDTHNLPGLATPGADSNSPMAGLPASPGIGVGSGGLIGGAESAVSSAAGMAASAGSFGAGGGAASAATQLAFQELNRAASYGAQVAGIGVEGLLESFMVNSGSTGGDWATTIPGRLLTGISGVRPTGQNTAGNTTKANSSSEGDGQGDTNIGFQHNGEMHVHSNDADDFSTQMQDQSRAANGAYPMSRADMYH